MNRFGAVLVLLVIGFGVYCGYFYKTNNRFPDFQKATETISSVTSQISDKSPTVQTATTDASSQLQTLSQRAGEVGQHAQNVLGTSIQVNEEEKKPIHESAIEYGRYIYCKQVVTEYEKATENGRDN